MNSWEGQIRWAECVQTLFKATIRNSSQRAQNHCTLACAAHTPLDSSGIIDLKCMRLMCKNSHGIIIPHKKKQNNPMSVLINLICVVQCQTQCLSFWICTLNLLSYQIVTMSYIDWQISWCVFVYIYMCICMCGHCNLSGIQQNSWITALSYVYIYKYRYFYLPNYL